jgi:hypothetical protein
MTNRARLWHLPIIYLVIYKNFDNIILKKYNRHLIYTVKYNVVWVDDESEESLDNLFEFLLIMVPILIPWGLSFLILKYSTKSDFAGFGYSA